MERRCELKLGVCKTSPEPTQPTGTNNTVPTIALTEWAEASTRTLPSVPMPVRWSHRIEKSEIKTMAEPNRYRICHSDFIFFFYEANKTTSYVWVLLRKQKQKKQKQKQNDEFYDRFSDSQGYKFIFFSQNLLTLSLALASWVSPDIAPRLSSRRRYASPELSPSLTDHDKTMVSFFVFSVFFDFVFYCFFLFICLGKLKAWMIKYLSWFECLIKFGCLGKHDLYVKC